MKPILLASFVLLLLQAIAVWNFRGDSEALSFSVAEAVLWVNLVIMTWLWTMAINKKKIALSSAFIVIKTLLLLALVGLILKQSAIKPSWFFVGVASFFMTIVIVALSFTRKEE